MDIRFEINGKRVNPNNIGDFLEKAVIERVQHSITKTVGGIRCSEHNQSPKIVCKGRNLSNLAFTVSGCCDKLVESVKSKLAA